MLLLEVLLGAGSPFLDRVEFNRGALVLFPGPLLVLVAPGGVFLDCFLEVEVINARKALGFPAPNPPALFLTPLEVPTLGATCATSTPGA